VTDEPETPAPPDAPAPISENSTPAPGSPPDADEPPDAWDRTAGWLDAHDPGLWSDTIHPDDRGHQLFADALAPLLQDVARGRTAEKPPVTVLG